MAGATVTGDGLIGHQNHVILLANLSHPTEIAGVSGEATTGVLNRFDVEGCDRVWTFEQDRLFEAICCPKPKLLLVFEVGVCSIEVCVWHSEG